MYKKYFEQDKEIFFKCLDDYKNEVEKREGFAIIMAGIELYRAFGSVPKSYRRYIKQAMRRAEKLNQEDNQE